VSAVLFEWSFVFPHSHPLLDVVQPVELDLVREAPDILLAASRPVARHSPSAASVSVGAARS
jgi:hypothetical protein